VVVNHCQTRLLLAVGLGHYAYMDVGDRATQDAKAETFIG